MQRITRAVRDFVLPLEPSGSLEASLTFQLEEDAAALGVRLHSKIQKRLTQEHPDVQSERAVVWAFKREDFECRLRGRIDVLMPDAGLILEEIKTTFRPEGLLRALKENPSHPFIQQVRMYAWPLASWV